MYGTVMVGRLRGSREDAIQALKDWAEERSPAGFSGSDLLFGEDGRSLVSVVRFATREDYWRLADDPGQDAWWRTRMMPLLDGEPQWYDGEWVAGPL